MSIKQFLYVIFSTNSFIFYMNSFVVYKDSFVYRLVLHRLQTSPSLSTDLSLSFIVYRLVLHCLQACPSSFRLILHRLQTCPLSFTNVPLTPEHGVFRVPGFVCIFRYIYITDSIFLKIYCFVIY